MERRLVILRRWLLLAAGLIFESFGIVLSIRADLGVTPISSIPYIFSLKFSKVTIGGWTLVISAVFLAIQLILLNKRFQRKYWLQIPILVLFCIFLDSLNYLMRGVVMHNYWESILFVLAGTVFLAWGITLCYTADICMNTGEAIVGAITTVTKKEFGKVKIAFDATLVVCTIIISLCFFNTLRAVREGTVVMALFTGFFVHLFSKFLNRKTADAAQNK